MNLPHNQMDVSGYNVFVFEHINTREYILFTCIYDKNLLEVGSDGSDYYPIDFSNQYILSVMEQKLSSSNSLIINESSAIYAREIKVGNRSLGEIHWSKSYLKSDNSIKIQSYMVSKATGMFTGISKVVVDSTLPIVRIYFVKAMDYF